jgi:diguanylate cyclase (GGDEF)-like protein/PAS domain S-box-containing protein
MLKNIGATAQSYKLNSRRLTICFIAIGVLVLLFVVALNFKIKTEASPHTVELPLFVAQKAELAKATVLTFSSYLQNIANSTSDEQRDTALISLYAREKSVAQLYQQLLKITSQKSVQVNDSQRLFTQWRDVRSEFYHRIVTGNKIGALRYQRDIISDYLWELEQSIESIRLTSEQSFEKMQFTTHSHANELHTYSVLLSIIVLSIIGYLLFWVWQQLILNIRYTAHRQSLIDEHVLIAMLNEKGELEDVSQALSQFFSTSKEALLKKSSRFLLSGSKQDGLLEKNILNTVTQGKQWRGEVAFKNAYDNELWAECSVTPDYDDDHKIVGYSYVFHDLTNKKLANFDKLTGLLNRRSYDEVLTSQLNLAVRNKYKITLAILDIDFFKRFNDLYGHPEGDIALRQLGELLTSHMQRANDFVFRIGGEEFALIISGLDEDKVALYLNSLREAVKALKIENKNSSVGDYLSVSIGAVILEQGYITEQKFYKAADKALYQAKTERDKVVVNTISSEKMI